jgi:Mrp family chromosome partitioning ATPase
MLLIIASVLMGGGLGVAGHFALARYAPRYTEQVVFEVLPGVSRAEEISTFSTMGAEDVRLQAETELAFALQPETIEEALGSADVRRTPWWRRNYGEQVVNDEIVQDLISELRPRILRGTKLFAIEWTTGDRESIPVVLNAIAVAHVKLNRQREDGRFESNRRRFLEQERSTRDEIIEKERQRGEFIRKNTILTLEDPRYNDVMASIKELNDRRALVESQIVASEQLIQTLRGKIEGNLIYSEEDELRADADPSVSGQIQRVEFLRAELEAARRKFTDEQVPQVRNLRNELESAEEVLGNRRRAVIIRNLNAQLRDAITTRQQAVAVQDQIDADLLAKSSQQQELSMSFAEFQSLQREIETLQQQLAGDLQLIRELDILRAREDASSAQIAVLARQPESRSFPKIFIMIPLGVLLIGGLTVGVVFLREITDRRVRTAADLEIIPGATVLGVVPEASEDPTRCREPELAVWAAPTSVMAESYRQIAGPLLRTLSTFDLRSLVLAGGMPRAGTTSVVSNLGASAAAAGRRVLVVDANFRRPRLASVMGGDDAAPGLGDVLIGAADVDAVMHQHESGCCWIGAGTPESRIVERLGTAAIDKLLASVSDRFDLVIFDAPPAVVAGDALSLAGRVDAAALVVQAGEEERGLVSRLVRQFAGTTRLVGIVLNRPRGTAGGYFRKNFAVMADYARARR